jgi:hypothetical protein
MALSRNRFRLVEISLLLFSLRNRRPDPETTQLGEVCSTQLIALSGSDTVEEAHRGDADQLGGPASGTG